MRQEHKSWIGTHHHIRIPNLPGSLGEIFLSAASPPHFQASTVLDTTPDTSEYSREESPHHWSSPMACLCLVHVRWALGLGRHFSFHFIALPLDPHLRPFIPFSSSPTFFHLFLFTPWIIDFTA